MARHPSTKLLSAWIRGEDDLGEHDEHVNSCAKCASHLDKLTEIHFDNVEAISAEFRPALLEVLAPPEDLHARVSERIAERLQARDDRSLFTSLLGTPVETTRIIVEPKIDED